MKFFSRTIATILCFVLLLGTLVACKKKDADAGDPSTSSGGEVTTNQEGERLDANGYLMDDLPETYDWGKADFTIYTWDNMKAWEWCESITQDSSAVSLSLYKRMVMVNDRFNVNIKLVYENYDWNTRSNFVTKLAASVGAESGEYDLVGQYAPAAGAVAVQEYYVDLYGTEYIDFEKPWWPKSITETATIGDKLYFATGDITPTLIRNIHCMFVNTDKYDEYKLADNYGGRSIYEIVNDGDWTFETLKEMGIGTVGINSEDVGIAFSNDVSADAMFYGAGFNLLNNDNGILAISDDLVNTNMINFYDEVQKMYSGKYEDAVIDNAAFQNNKALFFSGGISDAQRFTEKDVQFTIIPMPKLNTDQTDYSTIANFWVTMWSIPVDASNKEMSGMIMEGLASQAYRSVTDEIYFDLFQARYLVVPEKADMLDLVSDSVVFDSARMFPEYLANIFSAFRNGVNGSDAWTTIYGNQSATWKIKIESLYTLLG